MRGMVKITLLIVFLTGAAGGDGIGRSGASGELTGTGRLKGSGGLAALGAETRVITEMELYNTVYRGEEEWFYLGTGSASLGLLSPRDPHVSGQLELEFYPTDLYGNSSASQGAFGSSEFYLKKAWVKTRFPGFKLTLGKTRLTWGQGMVFNAGDLIFGSTGALLDLTARELRSDTAWLTAVNVPFGPFAFAEAVVLPPSYVFDNSGEEGEANENDISRSSLGGRLYCLAGDIKVETGYLYKGEEKVSTDVPGHRPYLALQGNLGADWYLATSAAFATEEQKDEQEAEDDWEKTLMVSGGLFHLQEINRNNSLTLRLEALVFPGLSWEEKESREALYALYLYPELSWTTGAVTASLQSVLSPLDGSAMVTAGSSWNLYQGLTLLGYLTFLTGEKSDTFAWDRGTLWEEGDQLNGFSCLCGLRYKF